MPNEMGIFILFNFHIDIFILYLYKKYILKDYSDFEKIIQTLKYEVL